MDLFCKPVFFFFFFFFFKELGEKKESMGPLVGVEEDSKDDVIN